MNHALDRRKNVKAVESDTQQVYECLCLQGAPAQRKLTGNQGKPEQGKVLGRQVDFEDRPMISYPY